MNIRPVGSRSLKISKGYADVILVKNTSYATVEPNYIDWEQVDLLVGDKDILPDEIREIYRDFSLDAAHQLDEFRESIALMDRDTLAKHAHYLKGAARSLGFVDLANRLGHLEHLHRSPNEIETERILSQLQRSLTESMSSLEGRFPSLRMAA
jgi:HPt (histidine-containing phosphotransfer) domain-containing protein